MTSRTKIVKAVAPYMHPDAFNFKMQPYDAWINVGGQVMPSHYPWRQLHYFAYKYEIPSLCKKSKTAQLRFVQPISISFDTFPGYINHEIIPLVWDCWPCFFEKMCRWLKKHQVQTAIFTSSQTAKLMQQRFPKMNILTITEGIDTNNWDEGQELKDRLIALYEIGSVKRGMFRKKHPEEYKQLFNKPKEWGFRTQEDYQRLLQNARMTVIFPRSITEPETAQGIETLTQRYWECMLSRILMVGHAPKELTDLIGYNPVIELDMEHDLEQIEELLAHIEDYQPLVDRNRETALKIGSWDIRMKQVMEWLRGLGYEV